MTYFPSDIVCRYIPSKA